MAIAIKVLTEHKKLNTIPGQTILLAAFVDDIFSLVMLGIMIKLTEGTGDLDAGGIVVSAAVYLDTAGAATGSGLAAMEATAARDKELKDEDKALGGPDAVVFKRLPMRQWDTWLNAKMPHPFFVKLEVDATSPLGYRTAAAAIDLLSAVPTAVPSGAFGGAEDWALSKTGAVAVSARPPLDAEEAWTTNRHIYLQPSMSGASSSSRPWTPSRAWAPGDDSLLGECLTAANPGYDTHPAFSPDGKQLAWLTMAGADYEADAVGICVHDLESKQTRTVLRAEADWAYSPQNLHWSKDGSRLLFTADVRSRRALCSLDVRPGAASGGAAITVLRPEHSTTLFGEHGDDGRLLVSQDSLSAPPELFTLAADGSSAQQLTHFNTGRMAGSALGRVGELTVTGPSGDEIQSWLVRPAGLSEVEEANPSVKYPLAVLYHGGPQGSTGDDWHYRWNLQFYASAGFAVLGINFRGSTGFGHEFCRAISAKGGVGWNVGGEDTIASVEHVLKEHGSWIDAERVVGLGASYGGFTSNWLNGNAPKGMFKALVCHCGTFDLRSSYFSTEELFFMEHEFGGTPLEPAAKEASSRSVISPS